jgi:sec-independent protein translocase protein TatC
MSEMSFFDHLRELRRRLIICLIGIAICAGFAFCYTPEVLEILKRPHSVGFEGYRLIGTGPGEGFSIRLWIAIFVGLLLASPLVFYQAWKFVAPGLYDEERKLVIPFVFFSTLLFLSGAWFGFEVILPIAFDFFRSQYEIMGVTPEIRLTEYLSMTVKTIVGLGVVFEMPVLSYFLAKSGAITHRTLIDGVRYAIVLIFIVAGVLSPPDVMSQFLLAAPLLVLYGISIVVAKWASSKTQS